MHYDQGGWPDKKKKSKEIHKSIKRDRKTKKSGCGFKPQAKRDKISAEWMSETLVSEHNHGPPTLSAGPAFRVRSRSDEQITEIINLSSTRQSPSQMIAYIRMKNPEHALRESDITNLIQKSK